MKKLIIVLFLLLPIYATAQWEIVNAGGPEIFDMDFINEDIGFVAGRILIFIRLLMGQKIGLK